MILLVIKGKRYGVHELEKLPKSLKPVNVTSKSNSTTFGYFGALNPLSNFYPAPFTHEGKKYHCSEQFIQSQKAKLFKDKGALKRIEQSTTGYQCKMEGQNISKTNQEEWSRKAKNLCLPGIRQKFVENAIPRDLLLKKTKGKRIVECCKDTVWGCGMAIHNDKCLDTLLWTNQGIMGEILEVVRSELGGTKLESLPALPTFDRKSSKVTTPVLVSTDTTIHQDNREIDENMDTIADTANTSCTSSTSSSSSSSSDDENNA